MSEERVEGSLTATEHLGEAPGVCKSVGAEGGVHWGKNTFNKNTWDMHGSMVLARQGVHSPEVQIQVNSNFES